MRITEDLINLLEDKYNEQDTFEPIIKGLGSNRKDSKRLESKGERKREKAERDRKKNGKWNLINEFEMLMGGV